MPAGIAGTGSSHRETHQYLSWNQSLFSLLLKVVEVSIETVCSLFSILTSLLFLVQAKAKVQIARCNLYMSNTLPTMGIGRGVKIR